jgi:hypothetical protein
MSKRRKKKHKVHKVWNENWTDEELSRFARTARKPVNYDVLSQRLFRMVGTMARIQNAVRIIQEACKSNPKGLPF